MKGPTTPDLLVLVAGCAEFSESVQERLTLASLSLAQRESIMKNRRHADRTRRLLARSLLALGMQRLTGADPEKTLALLRHAPAGQPELPEIDWTISFSHAGEYAACAIGTGTGRVGVDVEEIQSLRREDFVRVFTLAEMRAIASAKDAESELIRRWTLKEAVLKLQGTGFIADPLQVDTEQPVLTADMPGLAWSQTRINGYWLSIASEYPWTSLHTLMPESTAELLPDMFAL